MTILSQYQYIRTVIFSCTNYMQLKSCDRMIDNFIQNNSNNSYYAMMFGRYLRKKVELKRYYYTQ